LKDPDWDNVYPAQQLAAAWHRRLLTGLFQYWKSNFVSALESGAALIMARKNKILAPLTLIRVITGMLPKKNVCSGLWNCCGIIPFDPPARKAI
jgi:hypothetical protein